MASAGVYDRSIDRRFGLSATMSDSLSGRGGTRYGLGAERFAEEGEDERRGTTARTTERTAGRLPFLVPRTMALPPCYEDFFIAEMSACSICEYCSSDVSNDFA